MLTDARDLALVRLRQDLTWDSCVVGVRRHRDRIDSARAAGMAGVVGSVARRSRKKAK